MRGKNTALLSRNCQAGGMAGADFNSKDPILAHLSPLYNFHQDL